MAGAVSISGTCSTLLYDLYCHLCSGDPRCICPPDIPQGRVARVAAGALHSSTVRTGTHPQNRLFSQSGRRCLFICHNSTAYPSGDVGDIPGLCGRRLCSLGRPFRSGDRAGWVKASAVKNNRHCLGVGHRPNISSRSLHGRFNSDHIYFLPTLYLVGYVDVCPGDWRRPGPFASHWVVDDPDTHTGDDVFASPEQRLPRHYVPDGAYVHLDADARAAR